MPTPWPYRSLWLCLCPLVSAAGLTRSAMLDAAMTESSTRRAIGRSARALEIVSIPYVDFVLETPEYDVRESF